MGARRCFGTKRVTQRRSSRGKILHLKQTHYDPKPDGYQPLPRGLLGSGYVRRLLKANTVEAHRLVGTVDWDRYKCNVRGVRWHSVGGWRVQFRRVDYEHNYFVKCSCYFRVSIYGFDRAKELAISYRQRLDAEWDDQQRIWADLDAKREAARLERRAARERDFEAAKLEGEGSAESFWGGGGYESIAGDGSGGVGLSGAAMAAGRLLEQPAAASSDKRTS